MMKIFQRWVIGGATGSREGAWFLVLTLVVAPLWLLILAELQGHSTGELRSVLLVLGPAVLTLWSVAHGLQKAIDNNLINKRQPEELE